MKFDNSLDRYVRLGTLHRVYHRVDVRKDLNRRSVGHYFAFRSCDIGSKKPLCRDRQALDPRRGDRFGAQQDPRESLGIRESFRFMVEPSDGPLRVGNVGRGRCVKGVNSPAQEIGKVSLIAARSALTAR